MSDETAVATNALPPVSKTAYVLERIRDDIASGRILPGQALRQADIATRYGVSATPVREALRVLESDGTITYSPHRGATVTELSPEQVRDLYLLRAEVEGLATQLAVERSDQAHIEQVIAVHERLAATEGVGDGLELSEQNRQFHFAIYDGGSQLITDYLKGIWTMMPPRVTLWQIPEQACTLIEQHATIVEAITAGDPKLARERMIDHIMTAEELRQRQPREG